MPRVKRSAVYRLAGALRGVLGRISAEVASRLRRMSVASAHAPSLLHWLATLADAARPMLRLFFIRGGNRAARRLASALSRRKAAVATLAKKISGPLSLARRIFNAIQSWVEQAVERLALDFAQSTLGTIVGDVTAVIGTIRGEIAEGLAEGEALPKLVRRVRQVIGSPERAKLIARTEAQRALYSGEMQADQQSGVVVGHKWLTAPAACPICVAIDGKQVRLGEPFLTGMSRKAAYATVYHPPAHPRCRCSMTAVIDPKFLRR